MWGGSAAIGPRAGDVWSQGRVRGFTVSASLLGLVEWLAGRGLGGVGGAGCGMRLDHDGAVWSCRRRGGRGRERMSVK